MIKGYVFYKEGKIPFVIKEYRMELCALVIPLV